MLGVRASCADSTHIRQQHGETMERLGESWRRRSIIHRAVPASSTYHLGLRTTWASSKRCDDGRPMVYPPDREIVCVHLPSSKQCWAAVAAVVATQAQAMWRHIFCSSRCDSMKKTVDFTREWVEEFEKETVDEQMLSGMIVTFAVCCCRCLSEVAPPPPPPFVPRQMAQETGVDAKTAVSYNSGIYVRQVKRKLCESPGRVL